MFFKTKSANVIIYSSIVIAIVIVSTIAGYTLYIQWKEDTNSLHYRRSIAKLTAEMFAKDIVLSNVNVKVWKDAPFTGIPVLEGSIKNNSQKTISSISIEVAFRRPDGSVAYRALLRPLGDDEFSASVSLSGIERTSRILAPGEGMSFKHLLRNCPRELVAGITKKTKLAKDASEEKVSLELNVAGVEAK